MNDHGKRIKRLETERQAHEDALLSGLTGPERVALGVIADAQRTGTMITPAFAERAYRERLAEYERQGIEPPAPVPCADLPALFLTLAGLARAIGEPDAAAFAEGVAHDLRTEAAP